MEHHDDPVGQLEHFVQVFADQQHRNTPAAPAPAPSDRLQPPESPTWRATPQSDKRKTNETNLATEEGWLRLRNIHN